MTDFLLILSNISKYNKTDIDQGKTPQDVYRICNCIRNVFCLSYSIRKSNILYLFILKNQLIVKFEGNKLRYLGPDERSQSLLLNKALNLSERKDWEKTDVWIKSTPGIYIKKFSANQNLANFCESLSKDKIVIFSDIDDTKPDLLEIPLKMFREIQKSLLIFTFDIDSTKIVNLYSQLSKIENNISFKLPSIKAIEDKILYINFQIDRFRDKNNDP